LRGRPADQLVAGVHRGLGDAEQQILVAGNPLELLDLLVGDPKLGVGIDPVDRRAQQLDQRVGDLPTPAEKQRRQQCQLHR
jgi:hypothetical protein